MRKNNVLSESLKDCLVTAGILSVASMICMILQQFSSTDTHVPMLFVLAVLCVSRNERNRAVLRDQRSSLCVR